MCPHRPEIWAGSRAGPPVSECVSPGVIVDAVSVTPSALDLSSLGVGVQVFCPRHTGKIYPPFLSPLFFLTLTKACTLPECMILIYEV